MADPKYIVIDIADDICAHLGLQPGNDAVKKLSQGLVVASGITTLLMRRIAMTKKYQFSPLDPFMMALQLADFESDSLTASPEAKEMRQSLEVAVNAAYAELTEYLKHLVINKIGSDALSQTMCQLERDLSSCKEIVERMKTR